MYLYLEEWFPCEVKVGEGLVRCDGSLLFVIICLLLWRLTNVPEQNGPVQSQTKQTNTQLQTLIISTTIYPAYRQ